MDPAANEAKTRRLYDAVWNERRLDLIEEWITPAFVGHYSAYPEPLHGFAGFRVMVDDLLTAIPDVRMRLEDTVAAGDKVVSRVTMTGTHSGPMLGFAPTGRPIEAQFVTIERYGPDGRAEEEWAMTPDLALSRQIGAL